MKRAQAGIVLRARFFQPHIFTDYADDVGLLFNDLG
jgi:hypothetical protein